MRTLLTALVILLAANFGCEKKGEENPKTSVKSPTQSPSFGALKDRTEKGLNGTIRIKDQSLKVTPFVSHDPHSDLKTNCLKAFDDATKKGEKNAVLCYDKNPRSKVSVLRIETYDARGFEKARENMANQREGAHFILRHSGSLYQILDIAHAARRDGALQPEEIRVLSAYPEKEELLYLELKHYLPNLKLEKKNHIPAKADSSSENHPEKGNEHHDKGDEHHDKGDEHHDKGDEHHEKRGKNHAEAREEHAQKTKAKGHKPHHKPKSAVDAKGK